MLNEYNNFDIFNKKALKSLKIGLIIHTIDISILGKYLRYSRIHSGYV